MSVLSHLAMARGWYGVPCEAPGGKLPCASGTYSPQEAGTRRPHVQYGGPGGVRVNTGLRLAMASQP